MATTTMCVPTATLIFMGVTLPVFTPSTETFAPEGNDVTFNAPFVVCARRTAGTPSRQSVAAIIASQRILRDWVMVILPNRNFRFQFYLCAKSYARHPLVSSSDHRCHSYVASAARLAVPLTGVVCFSLDLFTNLNFAF